MIQREIKLRSFSRGFHIITGDVESALPELRQTQAGLLHIFIRHTSASITLNENADPTVRTDMQEYLDRLAPENESYFRHTMEGPDDMPAHIKASLIGNSVTIPVSNGRLMLGTWQGIYLGEHRDHGGQRMLVLTLST